MDAETAALIADLLREDEIAAQDRRVAEMVGRGEDIPPITPEQQRVHDTALITDAAYLEELIAAEEAALHDRLAAEMLSRGEALPPPTPAQSRLSGPVVNPHPRPAASAAAVISPAAADPGVNQDLLARALRPKFLRYNLWRTDENPTSRSVAEWTETATPLPSIPQSELDDLNVKTTIAENPHLFKIVTPINVDRFEELLRDHPNPAFVASVCRGLREGFWPWANTHMEDYPITHDESRRPPRDPRKAAFLEAQRQEEMEKDRFSLPFGPDLLPGMYSMPVHAVPKSNSDDMRMVTDHSAGKFSLNSMISREDTAGYPLDNMKHLGEILLHIRKTEGDRRLVMFKSDVAEAYRLMPVHPHWQIKQVNTINGSRNIDRNNAFGGRGSGCIWIAFNGLVTWIAVHVKGLTWLRVYSDDSFMPEWSDHLTYDPEFEKEIPTSQFKLLELWRELGIPYKKKKQLSDSPLTIIGIDVDPNAMTFSLSPERRENLLKEIADFCRVPGPEGSTLVPSTYPLTRQLGASLIASSNFWEDIADFFRVPGMEGSREYDHDIRAWQRLGGTINWAFNVFPLLRPCLNNFYSQIPGEDSPNQTIFPNIQVRRDLEWAADHIRTSDGVHLLRSLDWSVDDADGQIFCDACPDGMGFWYPALDIGFYSPVPLTANNETISVYQALSVLSALDHTASFYPTPSRIVIFTSDTIIVNVFASLRAKPKYNEILKASVDILLSTNHQLRVLHVSNKRNDVATAISCHNFARALGIRPELTIHDFTPPRVTLQVATARL